MTHSGPVLALGLDAVQSTTVERLLGEGRLPNLAGLLERGTWAPVRSRPSGFLSMVWPTLFTGQTLGAHGWYFNKLWSPDDQSLRYLDRSWLPARTFWDDLDPRFRLALLDVPFAGKPGPGFNGVFLNGWQAHDDFGRRSVPPTLYRELRAQHGSPAMRPELFGPQNAATLRRQWHEGVASLEQFGRITGDIASRERWDLLLAVFGGAHRSTHYLWSLDEADVAGLDAAERRRLEGARDDIYEGADRALAPVLAAAPDDARILVFSLHGMDHNRGWAEHFGAMCAHVHAEGRASAPKQGLVYRLKKALPWEWVREVTTRLPSSVNHALVPLWSRRMLDWSSTRFFALPLDLNGYVRVNLKGREKEGIVEPGPAYDALLDRLKEDFLAFRDLRTGEPIVRAVVKTDDLVGPDAPRRWVLPDLIVEWSEVRAHGSPGVSTPYGELRWDPDAPLPSGRSGNHVQGGWCVAAGPGIQPGRRLEAPVDSADLAPTLLEWIGAALPERLEGTPERRFVDPAIGAIDRPPRDAPIGAPPRLDR